MTVFTCISIFEFFPDHFVSVTCKFGSFNSVTGPTMGKFQGKKIFHLGLIKRS